MMRKFLTMSAVAGFVLLAAGAAAAKDEKVETKRWIALRDEPVDYSRYEERRKEVAKANGAGAVGALGLGLAGRDELGTNPVIDDPKLKAAVEVILKKLIPPGITPPHYEVILVDDMGIYTRLKAIPSENQEDTLEQLSKRLSADYGAAATRGGGLILPLGTLHATQNPDELSFVLGHEMSHLLYDHFKNEDREKAINQMLSVALVAAMLVSRNSATQAAQASIGAALVNNVLARRWDREQEKEADELGAELMIETAGYAPAGAYNVLERVDAQDKQREKMLDIMCGPGDAGDNFFKGLFSGLVGKAKAQGKDPNNPACNVRKDLLGGLFKTHPSATDRLANLHTYVAKWYKEEEKRIPSPFKNAKGKPVDNFVAFASPDGDANQLALAYKGLDAVYSGNIAGARAILRTVHNRGAKEQLAPVLILRYQVAKADGKRKDALQFLVRATKVPQVYPDAFEFLTQEYENDKRWADAVGAIDNWQQRVGRSDGLYPRLIADLYKANQTERLQTELEACRAVKQPVLVSDCEVAANPAEATSSTGAPATAKDAGQKSAPAGTTANASAASAKATATAGPAHH